jgi:ankyrin repeat protein
MGLLIIKMSLSVKLEGLPDHPPFSLPVSNETRIYEICRYIWDWIGRFGQRATYCGVQVENVSASCWELSEYLKRQGVPLIDCSEPIRIKVDLKDGRNPLHYNSLDQAPMALKNWLASGLYRSDALDDQKRSPFHYWASTGRYVTYPVDIERCGHILLESGVDINSVDGQGLTPLDYVCRGVNVDSPSLDDRDDLFDQSKYHNEPSNSRSTKRAFLVRQGAKVTPSLFDFLLTTYPHRGDEIQKMASLTDQELTLRDLLRIAANSKKASESKINAIVSGLKQKPGAAAGPDSDLDLCALLVVGRQDDHRLAKLLLDHGLIGVDQHDGNGLTALHHAAQASNLKVCQLLVSMKAAVGAADQIGDTPLHLACRVRGKRSERVIEYLVASGGSVLQANEAGETPLNILCRR